MRPPVVIPNCRRQRTRRIQTATGRRSRGYRQRCQRKAELQRHRILQPGIPLVPGRADHRDQHHRGEKLDRERLPNGQIALRLRRADAR